MLDHKKVLLLVFTAAVSLASLVTAAIDATGRGARRLETCTASSRSATASLGAPASPDGCPTESGWAAGGIAPGLFGS